MLEVHCRSIPAADFRDRCLDIDWVDELCLNIRAGDTAARELAEASGPSLFVSEGGTDIPPPAAGGGEAAPVSAQAGFVSLDTLVLLSLGGVMCGLAWMAGTVAWAPVFWMGSGCCR